MKTKEKTPLESGLKLIFERLDSLLDDMAYHDQMSRCTADGLKRSMRSMASDVLKSAAREAELWTKRCDDAKRIPDLLHDYADGIKGR